MAKKKTSTSNRKKNKVTKPKAATGWTPTDGPEHTIVIMGPEGTVYKMTGSEWGQYQVQGSELTQTGVIEQLRDYGSYLTYLPPDIAAGIGHLCTVVNLEAILKNRS